MFHVNTYASVTKGSIIKEDFMMMMMNHICSQLGSSFSGTVRPPQQCSLQFLKVCARIKFLLCNMLPGLICIWNDVYVMYEICAKTFNIYVRSKISCVRSSHGLYAHANAHSLEVTLLPRVHPRSFSAHLKTILFSLIRVHPFM